MGETRDEGSKMPEPSASNLALSDIQYKTVETGWGKWKVYVYPDGKSYREYRTYFELLGRPFIHCTLGKCPETGARKTANGVIAVGKYARGIIAVGQFAMGIVTIAQFGVGLLLLGQFGIAGALLAQFGLGVVGAGQVAIMVYFGMGQLATGYVAIGQVAVGQYALGQIGIGKYVWSKSVEHPEAVEFFRGLYSWLVGG